ncbi:MAG: helix-turn-helix domain-containing protein [Nitrospira sp.]|nr:helix-turn-helix domain-containing protein [Nitrospira sp.]
MSTHQSHPTDGKLWPVQAAAKHFAVCPHALYRKFRQGKLPHYKFGRKVLVDLEELRVALRA